MAKPDDVPAATRSASALTLRLKTFVHTQEKRTSVCGRRTSKRPLRFHVDPPFALRLRVDRSRLIGVRFDGFFASRRPLPNGGIPMCSAAYV